MKDKILNFNFYKKLLTQHPEYFVFGFFIILNIIKYFLITNLDPDEFLFTYKFVSFDSYDWLANGIRLFENDSISYRNPGLPLIINFLHRINILYLLPLINQIVYLVIALYLYKICKIITKNNIALLITFLFLINFSFNVGANMILADYYSVVLITASIYYLLTKKYILSFVLIFSSLVFQNLSIFFIPLWLIKVINDNWKETKIIIRKKRFKEILKPLILLIFTSVPFLAWLLFKYIKFGNPLNDNIGHLDVVHLDHDSASFYFVNSIALFSPLILVITVYIVGNLKKVIRDRNILFLLIGLSINIIFWVFIYDWDDRRFLLYFIPWLYPLIAWFVDKFAIKFKVLTIILLIIFYPTTLPVTSLLAGNEFPLVHNKYLEISYNDNKFNIEKRSREDFRALAMNLNPTFYNVLVGSEYYRSSQSTWYSFYTDYVNKNYNQDDMSICIDKSSGIKNYTVSSVLVINKNVDLDKVSFYKCILPQE